MSRKLRIVFDTNIFISGIVYGGPPLLCIDLAREGKIELYVSNKILFEIAIKLREKFDWEDVKINKVIHNISTFSQIIDPKETVDVIKPDLTDNKILEVAKKANADYIITGDKKHILSLKRFEKAQILLAADFLKLVDIGN